MKPAQQPSKEVVRGYIQGRIKAKTPPPDQAEIRRQLGWSMLNAQRECAR